VLEARRGAGRALCPAPLCVCVCRCMCVHVCEHCALARGAAQVRIASINASIKTRTLAAVVRHAMLLPCTARQLCAADACAAVGPRHGTAVAVRPPPVSVCRLYAGRRLLQQRGPRGAPRTRSDVLLARALPPRLFTPGPGQVNTQKQTPIVTHVPPLRAEWVLYVSSTLHKA
jgi:hypothetical protein